MALPQFSNNFRTLLSGPLGPSDTDILVVSTVGLPTMDAGDWFYATLQNTDGDIEIIKVTQYADNMLTAVRAQDDTDPLSWIAGDIVELRLVSQGLRELDWRRYRNVADGLAPLNELGIVPDANLPTNLLTEEEAALLYVELAVVGQPSGVAELDATGVVPDDQLPDYLPEAWLAATPPEPTVEEPAPVYRVAPLERYQEVDEAELPVGDPRGVVPLAFMHPDVDADGVAKIPLSWLGVAATTGDGAHAGVASLDEDGDVPAAQIPDFLRERCYTVACSGREDAITAGSGKMSFHFPYDIEGATLDFTLRSKDSGTVEIEVYNDDGTPEKLHAATLSAPLTDLVATAVPVTVNAGAIAKNTVIRVDFISVSTNALQVVLRVYGKIPVPA
jgi:hypothetical protein